MSSYIDFSFIWAAVSYLISRFLNLIEKRHQNAPKNKWPGQGGGGVLVDPFRGTDPWCTDARTDAELVVLYKTQLLSYLEYRTPALYHATRDILERLDNVQSRFLRDAGIDDVTALMEFNLAPLATRRDIAMLGVIHRTIIGRGPAHFKQHFRVEHDRRVHDPRVNCQSQLLSRSALGLVAVYNLLASGIRSADSVKEFQTRLQTELKLRAEAGVTNWQQTYSPRMPLRQHPLRQDGAALLIQRELDRFFDSSGDETW
jgi:hypothetical protein